MLAQDWYILGIPDWPIEQWCRLYPRSICFHCCSCHTISAVRLGSTRSQYHASHGELSDSLLDLYHGDLQSLETSLDFRENSWHIPYVGHHTIHFIETYLADRSFSSAIFYITLVKVLMIYRQQRKENQGYELPEFEEEAARMNRNADWLLNWEPCSFVSRLCISIFGIVYNTLFFLPSSITHRKTTIIPSFTMIQLGTDTENPWKGHETFMSICFILQSIIMLYSTFMLTSYTFIMAIVGDFEIQYVSINLSLYFPLTGLLDFYSCFLQHILLMPCLSNNSSLAIVLVWSRS